MRLSLALALSLTLTLTLTLTVTRCGGEEAPIKPKLYFRPQSARAKRKEKAAPP